MVIQLVSERYKKRIEVVQHNLLAIRHVLGWSAKRLGEEIGVTRQTINNIEVGRNKLNQTQFLALLWVFDEGFFSMAYDVETLNLLVKMTQVKTNKIVYGRAITFEDED